MIWHLIMLLVINGGHIPWYDSKNMYLVEAQEDYSEMCGTPAEGYHPMIEGGSPVGNGSAYPWVISFRQNPKENHCAGTIIDDFHILTAAHCLGDSQENSLKVHFQTSSSKKLSRGVDIDKIIKHPRFGSSSKSDKGYISMISKYDIALVKLKQKIQFNKYKRPICLPDSKFNLPLGSKNIIAGWGESQKGEQPEELHHGSVKRLNFSKCVEQNAASEIVKDYALCVGATTQTTCPGDSGGPLMHKKNNKYYLVGILSGRTAAVFCSPESHRVYTDVAKFLNWIQKNKRSSNSKGRNFGMSLSSRRMSSRKVTRNKCRG